MKDAYSFDLNEQDAELSIIVFSYLKTFNRLGLSQFQ